MLTIIFLKLVCGMSFSWWWLLAAFAAELIAELVKAVAKK